MTRITTLALSGMTLLALSVAMVLFLPSSAARAATHDVAVVNFDYSPAALAITVGDTVQ